MADSWLILHSDCSDIKFKSMGEFNKSLITCDPPPVITLLSSHFSNFVLFKNNCTCPDIKVSLKLPLIIGGIVWAAATYFKTLSTPTDMVGGMLNLNESSSIFDPELEMLSEIPNFD